MVGPWLHLEFDIPRLGRRVDAVLVTSTAVLPIEFKVGAKKFHQLDYEQAWDFRLDLKNFHAPSHAAATNLAVTNAAVERIIVDACTRGRKAIVFVTGVPGAGKTLVGLSVATRHGSSGDAAHSCADF